MPTNTLQSHENFDNHVTAVIKRLTQQFFLLIERRKARARGVNIGFDVADPGSGADEVLIKFAPVQAQRLDFHLQLGLALHRIALAGERRVEVLVMLLECIHGARLGRSALRSRWRNRWVLRRGRVRGSHTCRRLGQCGAAGA